jgi:hypothetical protein
MIFTFVGTLVAGALFGGSLLAASLIAGGLAMAAKLGINYYMNRQKSRKYSAVQGQIQYGGDVPVQTLFGIGKTRGHRVFYGKWGSGNKFNGYVFLLANGWCNGLEPYVYFYGSKQTLVERPKIGNETAHYGVAGYDNLISIRFYDGRPGQGIDQKLVNDTRGLGRKWKDTSVGAGLTYVVFEREFNVDKFDKGRLEVEWVLRGLRCYDLRKDSSVAGGSGLHRRNNPATWEFSLNPAVHRLNYQLGLRGMVSDRTLIGEGKSIGQLDLSTYVASMNVCDELRAGKTRYTCNVWVTGDDDHTEVLREFEDAMAGFALNRRGLSGVLAGAPQVPVMNIGPDDIPAERESEISYRKSAFDLFNMMSGQFTSPESNWGAESLKPIVVNADVSADGRRRQTSYDFLQVTDADTAQYLLNIRYRQQRKGGKAKIPVSWRVGTFVQEGDWITYDGLTWSVDEWQVSEDFRFSLVLTETGSDIYSEAGIEPGPIVIPPTEPFNPSLLATVQNFNIEVGMIKGAEGFEQPVVRFSWDPPDDPTIKEVRFRYRVADEFEIFEDQCTEPEAGEYVTGKNILSGRFYQGQATITTVPDRFKSWTPWKTSVAPTGMQSVIVQLEQMKGAVKDVLKNLTSTYDRVDDLLEQLAAATAVGTGQNILTSAAIVKTTNALAASFIEQSAKIEEVEGQIVATAGLLAGVQAQVDDVSASGLLSMTGTTNPTSGVFSEVSITARASKGGQTAKAAQVYRVVEVDGQLVAENFMFANRTYFVSETGDVAEIPLAIVDGEVLLKVGRIAKAVFDQLESTNGKWVQRGYGNLADLRIFV